MAVRAFLISALAAAASAQKYFITFGDSYSQTGFDPSSTQPSSNNILGNPPLPGWTTTGGLNWIGDLITEHNDSLILSYNFAYGGATTNASLVAPYETTVLSLIDQVAQFTQYIPSGPWETTNTLFGVWMGVNDIGNSWWLSNVSDVIAATMTTYFSQMEILYTHGARDFLFLNVPPINRTPNVIAQGSYSVDGLASGIAAYNSALASNVQAFKAKHSDVTATVVDTQAPFNQVLDDATGDEATCYNADGVTCLWFNDYHPGQKIHEAVAEAVVQDLGTFF